MTVELQKLEAMVQYATTRRCLRQYILQYFGEAAKDHCQGCSNCCTVSLGKPVIQQTEEALLQGLRAWRLMTAIEEGVPSYRILSDETLQDLAQKQPLSFVALEQVVGMGERKIEQYGEILLKTISQYQQNVYNKEQMEL